MDHPFKISETYENNKGSYTVLDIFPPQMQIEYAHGSKSVVNIDMQARIWDRIQTERAIEEEVRQRKMRTGRLPITFFGLEESDFKENVASTTWRSCEGLGGLVSQQLSDISGNNIPISSHLPSPSVLCLSTGTANGQPEGGSKATEVCGADKFRGAFYGFYIEKSNEQMGSDWYWPRFREMLSQPEWQAHIERVMTEKQLQWFLRFEEVNDASGVYLPAQEVIITLIRGRHRLLFFFSVCCLSSGIAVTTMV